MGAIFAIAAFLLLAKAAGSSAAPLPVKSADSSKDGAPKDTNASPATTKPSAITAPFKVLGTPAITTAPKPLATVSPFDPALTATIPPDPYAWPGIQSLPPAYRDPAMAAVQNLRYQWVIADEGPTANMDPCLNGGPCSSNAVYAALHPIYVDQAKIEDLYGGIGGANAPKALAELSHAYAKLKAVGR